MLIMTLRTVRNMLRLLTMLAVTSAAVAQSPVVASNPSPSPASVEVSQNPAATVLGKLPPLPKGKSTVIGGEIQHLNPVLDRFTLKVFGGGTMKILFDERTQVFRNGVRIPVLDLRPDDHASVETTLDGSRVFALRIHMLTHLPQGQTEGQVASYAPQSRRLTIDAELSQQPIVLDVPPNTPISRVGETTFSAGQGGDADLVPGSLVRVTFTASGTGRGVATYVAVLATSGAHFVFGGVLRSLDMATGQMIIVDPRDNHRYPISFDPAQFSESRNLRLGSHLRVTARFDGRHYVATAITVE